MLRLTGMVKWVVVRLLLFLFATTRSVVKVPVIEVAIPTNLSHWIRHRSSGDKSVGCALQANKCITPCGEAPLFVQMSLGSVNTLCL